MLDDLGISADGRVGTFGWNTANHLELYFAAPCSGRVLHTLNIRLFPEQLTYIANHAEDEVDLRRPHRCCALLWPLLDTFETVRHVVVMDDGAGELPTEAPAGKTAPRLRGPARGRRRRSSWRRRGREPGRVACATRRGTTGNPKGVVYSHRSTFLHTMGVMAADAIGASETDTHPAGGADVPRQRLGPGPRRGGQPAPTW